MTSRLPIDGSSRAPGRSARAPRAFTLVEMVVVIGIIVILTALTVSASIVLVEKAERRQTNSVLQLLDMAAQEWETRAGRTLSWGPYDSSAPPDQQYYDITDGNPHVFTTSDVIRRIGALPEVQAILAQIPGEFTYTYDHTEPVPPWLPVNRDANDPDPFVQGGGNPRGLVEDGSADGSLAILDAWGQPVRAVHPGRLHYTVNDPPEWRNEDGTIFVQTANSEGHNEQIYGVCEKRRILFVSAGPDGKFGDLSFDPEDDRHKQAHDNAYSYAPRDEH